MTEDKKQAAVHQLSVVLASSYSLYVKTHNYHWNVTGPMFTTLHTLFEAQYTELATAIDEIAERIRALGAFAPGSFSAFRELSSVEEENDRPDAETMIENLVADHESLSSESRRLIEIAGDAGDQASEDLGVRRLDTHDKAAWMLRSHLK